MTIFFLPGKEDDILTCGRKLGITGTVVLWFVFVLVSAFLPAFKKTEYKTVRITLASTPVEKTEEPAEPAVQRYVPQEPVQEQAQAAAAEPENAPAQVKKAEPAKKAAAARKQESAQTSAAETKKTTPEPPVAYAKDPMDRFAEQNAQKEKDVQWDDSAFADASVTSNAAEQNTPRAKQVTGASALSGKSASAAQQGNRPVSSTSESEDKKSADAGDATKAALGAISATTYTQPAGAETGVSSQTSLKAGRSSDGKVAVQMSDGTARTLLNPPNPSIRISDENAGLIDGSRTVEVRFKVFADGNVPRTGISITRAVLPRTIQDEILDQVSQWRFTTASSDGDAVFTLTIIKK